MQRPGEVRDGPNDAGPQASGGDGSRLAGALCTGDSSSPPVPGIQPFIAQW